MKEGTCFGESENDGRGLFWEIEGCCGPGYMHHDPGPMGHGQVSMVHGQVSKARELKGVCSAWKGPDLEGACSGRGFWKGL